MKKVAKIFLCFCLILLLTACDKGESKNAKEEKSDFKNFYREVLENKRAFLEHYYVADDLVNVNGSKKIETYYSSLGDSKTLKYVFIDLDQDDKEEMVIDVGDNNIILKYDEETKHLNGYVKSIRSFKRLRVNGYYEASYGASSRIIFRSLFGDDNMVEIELAQEDDGKYTINKEETTKKDYQEYIKKNVDSQKEVTWLEYKVQETKTEEEEDSKQQEVETTSIENGVYRYTFPNLGMEVDGSQEIITLKDGMITFEGKYFDDTKKGTYTVNGNTLVAVYTEEIFFNQGMNRMETEVISETVTYNIVDGTIRIHRGNLEHIYVRQ